ncbi:hypothetical protein ABK040_008781 [Willaertia magna]
MSSSQPPTKKIKIHDNSFTNFTQNGSNGTYHFKIKRNKNTSSVTTTVNKVQPTMQAQTFEFHLGDNPKHSSQPVNEIVSKRRSLPSLSTNSSYETSTIVNKETTNSSSLSNSNSIINNNNIPNQTPTISTEPTIVNKIINLSNNDPLDNPTNNNTPSNVIYTNNSHNINNTNQPSPTRKSISIQELLN